MLDYVLKRDKEKSEIYVFNSNRFPLYHSKNSGKKFCSFFLRVSLLLGNKFLKFHLTLSSLDMKNFDSEIIFTVN